MATAIIIEGQIVVPMNLHSSADFRRWAVSDEFPEQGRIVGYDLNGTAGSF